MKRWEYKVFPPRTTKTGDEKCLTEFGEKGWELVCLSYDGDYVLKRELPPPKIDWDAL